MLARVATCLLSTLGVPCSAMAAAIKVLAPNAAKESVSEAIGMVEKTNGQKVVVTWSGTEAIAKRVAEGELVDVVVNSAQNIGPVPADLQNYTIYAAAIHAGATNAVA
jgi:molybdate transport system substrate-binding protein